MSFLIMDTQKLKSYVKDFKWTRSIKQLHVHHTWKPDHSDYNGSNGIALQTAMRNYHVNTNGWNDIAQHLTLLPDGQWVTGRDFNQDPASILGWNDGAFCIEMLGNFDAGFNKFTGQQANAMFEFCAFFVLQMKLDVNACVKFHRDNPNAGKTCPGTGIERGWFMNTLNEKIKESSNSSCAEEWKIRAVDELAKAGLLNEPLMWKQKINEPMPVWGVLILINELFTRFSEKK
ncbi:MAG: peptidoglycan recognition family protein [Bacillota bacterium]|nr:peptidoglycan recognition family protein [Bacillota bacterium]